ncbi:MAG: NAD(P)-dependent oxidoreductase [Lachnospiraceae bacterium]|nr:NAD(P)-dependent oxidoreductase [Lachnospiraceae bacterium]
MRYVVTGANGYIGRFVVKGLLDQGEEVVAVDLNYDGVDSRAEHSDVSILEDDDKVYDKLGKPDACIHLAWRNGFVHNHMSHIEDLPKHVVFLNHLIEGGIKQIVVMGSMHEVGYWEGAIDDNTPTNPESFYGISKNALRQALNVLISGKDVCLQWIRGYYILGDDLKNHSIFTKLLEADKEGKETFPFTSGKNKYDFISVQELAEQIVAVARQNEVDGIINCCTGVPMTLAERVEQFIQDNHLNIKLDYGAFPDRSYDSPGIWGSPEKINSILGK